MNISKIASRVSDTYRSISAENDAVTQVVIDWFASDSRRVSDIALYSVESFVRSELNWRSEGYSGIQRGIRYEGGFRPEYVEKLRSIISTDAFNKLEDTIASLVLTGYLFAEYIAEVACDDELVRVNESANEKAFFKRFMFRVHSSRDLDGFLETCQNDDLEAYSDSKTLWFHNAAKDFRELLKECDVLFSKHTWYLPTYYFEVGMALRIEETKPFTEAEQTRFAVTDFSRKEPSAVTAAIVLPMIIGVVALIFGAIVVAYMVSPNQIAVPQQEKRNGTFDPSYRPKVGDHYVSPYQRGDGTKVDGHMRTNRDDSFWNNYSSDGNVNPYTGKRGTRMPAMPAAR